MKLHRTKRCRECRKIIWPWVNYITRTIYGKEEGGNWECVLDRVPLCVACASDDRILAKELGGKFPETSQPSEELDAGYSKFHVQYLGTKILGNDKEYLANRKNRRLAKRQGGID